MDIGIEALATATFLLLPGFVAASLFGVLSGKPAASGVQVTLYSLIASLVLFAVAMVALLLFDEIKVDLDAPASEIIVAAKSLPTVSILKLFVAMLVTAVFWGSATGLMSRYALGNLLYNARLTPIAPEENVFTQIMSERYRTRENLKKRSCGQMDVPWLRITGENRYIFGRLQQGSIRISPDEPFEIYLSPCYQKDLNETKDEDLCKDLSFEGTYCHILPSDQVEVFTAKMDWTPSKE